MALQRIEIDDEQRNFEGYFNGIKVCDLNLYCPEDKPHEYWLNGINTNKDHVRNGFATELLNEAILIHDKIYISTASKTEQELNNDISARYLSTEGGKLVYGLIDKGILKPEWMKNPFSIEDELFK